MSGRYRIKLIDKEDYEDIRESAKDNSNLSNKVKSILNKALNEPINFTYEGRGKVIVDWLEKSGTLKFPAWYFRNPEVQGFLDLDFEGEYTSNEPEELTESFYDYFLLPLIDVEYSKLGEYQDKIYNKVDSEYERNMDNIFDNLSRY